jgi:hypothetical protein
MFLRWLTGSLATGLRAKAMLGMSPEAQSTKCRIGRSDVWDAKSLEMALVYKAPVVSLVTGAMSVSCMRGSRC